MSHNIKEIEIGDSSLLRCKWCDSVMMLRTRKTDGHQFYGCIDFPECRYTATVEEVGLEEVGEIPDEMPEPDFRWDSDD